MDSTKVFIDSGGHSLYTLLGKNLPKDYMETDGIWEYVDTYAAFIHQNEHLIETYVNVDIIFNPELTWKIQRYLEDKWKLKPMPVYHIYEDFKWFKLYMDNYDYIGISGLSRFIAKAQWITTVGNPVFTYICPAPTYMPIRKIHSFAMTAPDLLFKYPFYSVDSTSWVQYGKYGIVTVPRTVNGVLDYSANTHNVIVSSRNKAKQHDWHMENMSDINAAYFTAYFESKGYKIGVSEFKPSERGYILEPNERFVDSNCNEVEIIKEVGLCNDHTLRDAINTEYFLDLEAAVPKYPWAWKPLTNMLIF